MRAACPTASNLCSTPSSEYQKTWSFSTILAIPSTPPGNCSVDAIENLLRNQILPERPERVTHIEARYRLHDTSATALRLDGYLQHSSGIDRHRLRRWFDAAWTPVGGRLSVNSSYKAYRASMSDKEYKHIQVFGTPKLGTGGTGKRNRTSESSVEPSTDSTTTDPVVQSMLRTIAGESTRIETMNKKKKEVLIAIQDNGGANSKGSPFSGPVPSKSTAPPASCGKEVLLYAATSPSPFARSLLLSFPAQHSAPGRGGLTPALPLLRRTLPPTEQESLREPRSRCRYAARNPRGPL
jgi:hypothetical protein